MRLALVIAGLLLAGPVLAQPINPPAAAASEDRAAINNAEANHADRVARRDAAVGNYAGAARAHHIARRLHHRAAVNADRAAVESGH